MEGRAAVAGALLAAVVVAEPTAGNDGRAAGLAAGDQRSTWHSGAKVCGCGFSAGMDFGGSDLSEGQTARIS